MDRTPTRQDALLHQLIYSMIVAGKSATFANAAIARLFPAGAHNLRRTVQTWIDEETLFTRLKEARTGNYTKLERGITDLMRIGLDLHTCTVVGLENIFGIGPKTARFFLLWTRGDAVKHAALDVHVLRWMREQGYDAPRQTPSSSKKYAELEAAFIREAEERGLTPAQLDAQIWEAGRRAYLEGRGQH